MLTFLLPAVTSVHPLSVCIYILHAGISALLFSGHPNTTHVNMSLQHFKGKMSVYLSHRDKHSLLDQQQPAHLKSKAYILEQMAWNVLHC